MTRELVRELRVDRRALLPGRRVVLNGRLEAAAWNVTRQTVMAPALSGVSDVTAGEPLYRCDGAEGWFQHPRRHTRLMAVVDPEDPSGASRRLLVFAPGGSGPVFMGAMSSARAEGGRQPFMGFDDGPTATWDTATAAERDLVAAHLAGSARRLETYALHSAHATVAREIGLARHRWLNAPHTATVLWIAPSPGSLHAGLSSYTLRVLRFA